MKTEETITTATEAPNTRSPRKAPAAKKTAKPATKKASKADDGKKRSAKTKTNSVSKKAAQPAAGKEEVRAGTKKERVIQLLRRKDGATIAEIAKATDWQNHSIRGFLSGHVSKKMGLTVESSKTEAGERMYRISQ